jgi:uncharacterized membrane protein YhiD involved in acid resistance
MKNSRGSYAHFFVGLAGVIAISEAISFGWYSEGAIVSSVLRNHALILFTAGVGFLAAGYFMRQSSARISALEQQVAVLQQTKD